MEAGLERHVDEYNQDSLQTKRGEWTGNVISLKYKINYLILFGFKWKINTYKKNKNIIQSLFTLDLLLRKTVIYKRL